MKQFVLSLIGVSLLSAAASFMTYKVVGAPDRSVACAQENLPEHFVCLATVREWPEDEILWVDARPRKDWDKDGVEDSVLVNDQEDWLDLQFGFMSKMNEELKPRVVVYCNQSGCGSSKYVAEQLR
ncbi:MAG: rhodanese-related sulfurtransferase, partial [Akkermansiaceae bacterium]